MSELSRTQKNTSISVDAATIPMLALCQSTRSMSRPMSLRLNGLPSTFADATVKVKVG